MAPLAQEGDERALEVVARATDQLFELASGEPANRSSPSASTTTRCAWRSASCTSCVEYTTAVPVLLEREQELPQPLALARVERRARLVEQQDRRLGQQADRDVHPLAVAAGEDAHLVVGAVLEPGLRRAFATTAPSTSAQRSSRANRRRFSATVSFP